MDDEKKKLNTSLLSSRQSGQAPNQSPFDIEDTIVIEDALLKRALESTRLQIHDKPRWAEG